uniref:Reverse transcriptase Ty1/copia-type domain-containing protein n=1 Tax=Ananas comosus var. bracteatus TaxID=296719 RepID=A0A6V7PW85_ANACO|nr:unnamed protein product [Ananas comosus var. bracteatus]
MHILFEEYKGKDISYEDDLLDFEKLNINSTPQDVKQSKEVEKFISKENEPTPLPKLSFFLGLQVKQMKDGIFINQAKYAKDLIKRFGLESSKETNTPMSASTKLDKDEKGKDVDIKLYQDMIGSLLYLTASRPDIMFSVCLCARFQAQSKESHLVAVKRILRYVKGTLNLGLWYPKGTSFNLIGFSDADFAGCKIDRKSTSGTCQFLGHFLVSWSSKKCMAGLYTYRICFRWYPGVTVEAEYITAGCCCAQVLWMKQTLEDFGVHLKQVPIKCDNTSAINLSRNPIQHSRTKHIEIRHHFIRDHILKGDVTINFVDTHHQLADIFTKPLSEDRFTQLRRELGMIDLNA